MGEAKRKQSLGYVNLSALDKQQTAQLLMEWLIEIEKLLADKDGKLTRLEFATALRLYTDDIMKAAMPTIDLEPVE